MIDFKGLHAVSARQVVVIIMRFTMEPEVWVWREM